MVEMNGIGRPLRRANGKSFSYAAPGPERHNSLHVDTIELFGPRYASNALILHLWDRANAIAIHEQEWLERLKAPIPFTSMPDILLYSEEKNWLILIELLTSHGPITEERWQDLANWCEQCVAERIYLSILFDKHDYKKSVLDIAWDSRVWIAHFPDHIIHHQ